MYFTKPLKFQILEVCMCMNAVCVRVCVYSSAHKNEFHETERIKSFC